jgi:hypothetical protein
MPESPRSTKIGEGHASAMFRQGLRELRASLYPESNVAQPPELGLAGTLTPGEIAESRRHELAPSLEDEQKPSPLTASLQQAESRPVEPNRDTKDRDR